MMDEHTGRSLSGFLRRASRRHFLALTGGAAGVAALASAPFLRGSKTAAQEEEPVSGGELVVANWDEPISLDPVNINGPGLNAANMIYDRLVILGQDGKHYPGLAESWEVAPDGLAYTFSLKEGVTFHDSTPFNAEAVKFNFDRATAPNVKGIFQISITGPYDRTEVVDEHTARVVLKQPFAPFMNAIADGFYGMVSPAAVEKFGADYDLNPVGTGPFTFVEWAPKSHVTVQKNPDYNWGSNFFQHEGPAYLDRVSVRLIPDANLRMTTVETGEVNVAVDIPPEEMERLSENPDLQVIGDLAAGFPGWIEINTPHAPVDDVLVRRAILWTVNPEELSQVLYRGAYPPAYTPLQPVTFGYDESLRDLYPDRPNPDKARALLDEGGWVPGADGIREKGGAKLETTINIVSASIQALPIKMAELVQAQLRDVGIQFTPQQYDTAALFDVLLAGDEMMTYAWGTSPDPDALRPLLHSSFIGNSVTQRVGYRDPHLDELLDQGASELDPEKRKAIYREIQEIMLNEALVVPMWYRLNSFLTQANVRGFTSDAYGYPLFYDTWMAAS